MHVQREVARSRESEPQEWKSSDRHVRRASRRGIWERLGYPERTVVAALPTPAAGCAEACSSVAGTAAEAFRAEVVDLRLVARSLVRMLRLEEQHAEDHQKHPWAPLRVAGWPSPVASVREPDPDWQQCEEVSAGSRQDRPLEVEPSGEGPYRAGARVRARRRGTRRIRPVPEHRQSNQGCQVQLHSWANSVRRVADEARCNLRQ